MRSAAIRAPIIAGLLVALGLLIGARALAQPERATRERQVATDRALIELRSRVDTLQKELVDAGKEQVDASDSLRESERAISDATRALDGIAQRQGALQQQLGAQQSELAAIMRQQATHEQALSSLAVAMYRRRPAEPLQLLLSGRGPFEVRRQLVYLRALYAARDAAFAEAARRAERLALLNAETGREAAELERTVQSARQQREVLALERSKRQRTLAQIGAQLANRRRELAAALADETRLSKLAARLWAIAAAVASALPPVAPTAAAHPRTTDSAPGNSATSGAVPSAAGSVANLATLLARYRGNLRIPAVGELVARFGVPRNGSGPAWKGWFIRAASGTSVQAVASGRVVFADWLRGFGNLIIVDHGEGFMSLYGNNDALLQQVGATVESGQVVAQAGSSGGAAESGVYFELRHNGVALDPKEWFER